MNPTATSASSGLQPEHDPERDHEVDERREELDTRPKQGSP